MGPLADRVVDRRAAPPLGDRVYARAIALAVGQTDIDVMARELAALSRGDLKALQSAHGRCALLVTERPNLDVGRRALHALTAVLRALGVSSGSS